MSALPPITAVISGVVAAALVPLLRRQAPRLGAVDHPGELSVHQIPTARLGGVAVWAAVLGPLSVLVGIGLVNSIPIRPWIILASGSTAIFLLGLADDIASMPPWPKLAAGVALALGVARYEWAVDITTSPGLNLLLSAGWIVFFVNAFNALDGLDGLAGGIGLTGAVFLAVWFDLHGESWPAVVCSALLGASFGFLLHNFPPSKGIFLGDCGSLFVGFVLAVMTLRATTAGAPAHADPAARFDLTPFFFLFVPVADAIITVGRRLAGGVSPLQGDRRHLYDALYRRTGSMRTVALTYYTAAVAAGLIAWWALYP